MRIASDKSKNKAQIDTQKNLSTNKGLTTAALLKSRYQTKEIKTTSGLPIIIRAIQEGDLLLMTGSPILPQFSIDNIDDVESAQEDIASMTKQEQINLITSPDFFSSMKRIVTKAVVSPNLTHKSPERCFPNETSIELLADDELLEIYTEIVNFSFPESEAETIKNFRQESEEE